MRMWLILPALSAALRLTMSSWYLSASPSYESSYWSVMKLYRTLLLFLVGTGLLELGEVLIFPLALQVNLVPARGPRAGGWPRACARSTPAGR